MPDRGTTPAPRIVRARPRRLAATSAGLLSTGLAPDLLQDFARRLAITGLTVACGFTLGVIINEIFFALGWLSPIVRFQRIWAYLFGALLALGVFGLSRRRTMSPARLIAIGLGFEVVGGFLTVLPEALNHVLSQPAPHPMGVSWLTVWIAFFPMIVPASPVLTVIAALVTASMAPLATWVATWGGHPWPPASQLAFHFVPSYVIALLTSYPAIVLHGLRQQVSEARALGSYHLEERLGGGGMGEVWRASHSMLARPAAIKLIHPGAVAIASSAELEGLKRRFELEAQATSSLSSPHTVALYDFGITEDGTFYYVMELLEGLDLERLVREHGSLPPERVVHLLVQVCDSLAEAHERGLVHRDVKPSNIHACRVGVRHDYVKVLDFGLVLRRQAGERDSRLTMADMTIGTPAYMAPESILGRPEDGRSDLYALGCVGYWLLTGREVFEGRSAVEVMSLHAHAAPEPPSRRAASATPPELDAAILSCLEKDPERRPCGAGEISRALLAVPLERPWTQERAAAWWEERIRPSAAAPAPSPPR